MVIDRENKTQSVSYYGYDAFGRRVVVQDKDAACMRSLYDGFTFDVIKQSPTLANGMFVDSNETGLRINRTGKATGDRYRYLDDDKNDGNRYFYLDEGTYKSVTSRYVGERTSITVNGVVAAQNAGGEVSYFTTDLLGSVRTTTDNAGFGTNTYTYDVFGSLVEGDLSGATDYGYLGKQFDPQTGLYNYGYRDYAPQVARFTTLAPICDGSNWFSYVNNDPVNFIDLWGLMDYDSVMRAFYNSSIVVITYDGSKNENGAKTGTMTIYSKSNNYKRNNYEPDVTVPIVSGNKTDPAYTVPITTDKKQESVKTSGNPTLRDENHGGEDNKMIRLDSEGNAIHEGNSLSNQDRSYTNGCIGVTGNEEKPDVDKNYDEVKNAIGDSNVLIITQNKIKSY